MSSPLQNTITTLEKTVDYLTDLKQKYSLLLQDKGSQVQGKDLSIIICLFVCLCLTLL